MIRLETRLRKLVQPARPEEPWPAYMGDGHGTCLVPGNEQYCYVIPEGMSIPIIVNGEDAPNLPGQPVWVGKDVYHKKVIRVIGRRTIDGVTPGTGAGLHGSSHYATGGDPVSIDASQITNCLVYASTGMIAHVNEGVVNFDGQPTLVASQDVDLTSYIPAGAGDAIWALITVDDTGTIAVDDSMIPLEGITMLLKSNIPAAASGKRALGAAKLYYGQTSLSKLSSNPDILPLAYMPDYYNGGGGGDAGDITYTPAANTDWDGDADPGNVDDALDQLADRVDDIEGAGYGVGDMTKAAYDADNDSKVESADHADTAGDADTVDTHHAVDFSLTGHTHTALSGSTGTVVFGWDGGQAPISATRNLDVFLPTAGTITGWYILCDQAATISIDVWKDTYANYPPTVLDTICNVAGGGVKITTSGVDKNEDTTLAHWACGFSAGDTMRFHLESNDLACRMIIALTYLRS